MSTALITYHEGRNIDNSELLGLYEDAGWQAYTKDIQLLSDAVQNSLFVITARCNKQLVGLVRVVGDGLTIIYIQDILVLKDFKRQGIGTQLLKKVLKKYIAVRQKVLLTDNTEETRSFYRALGFEACNKDELMAFIKKA